MNIRCDWWINGLIWKYDLVLIMINWEKFEIQLRNV